MLDTRCSATSLALLTLMCWLTLAEYHVHGADKRKKLQPVELLVVAPHSDDEAIGCTGVMMQAIARGKRVGVVVISQGDGFPKAAAVVAKKDVEKLTPEDFLKLAAIRQRHTIKAMGNLGIRAEDLMFLGYPDSILSEIYRAADDKPVQQKYTGKSETYGEVVRDYHSLVHGKPAPYLKSSIVGDLAEIIKTRQPKEIYVTNEVDSHADHRASFWFVRDAAKSAEFRGKLLTFVVHGKEPDKVPDVRIPLSKQEQDRKRLTIEVYQAGLSPIHDGLADKYAGAEERFWLVPLK